MRAGVDVLTMTATPIPRTLNMSLNKLKDISTITTPPPGRLPVVTEVRKYNLNLIRERILFETERGGQVYFLHNEVRSIDGLAKQLEALVPEVKFLVAHGQLRPEELEQKVRAFKNGEAQVLIASTIIENGIDLANANTLIVSRAEKFGLAQLYQLRGRVGRGRTQAYAFFLYHGQKLALEAKKRLRAIVEANELGSGFQIAMRDLEIRGAGEVLGVNQAGAIKNVGVSHFMRMLNKTVDQMRRGEIAEEIEETENITVEIPLSAYIPGHFIPNTAEKIRVYQELASAETIEQLDEMRRDLRLDFGILPLEVENLCRVIRLKMLLRNTNLSGIKINRASHKSYEVVLRMGKNFTPDQIFGIVQKGKYQWTITAMALKLKLEQLPVNWYDELIDEIELLTPLKK
jgi:transcription-repair coupling factor (superfamily II helicase)